MKTAKIAPTIKIVSKKPFQKIGQFCVAPKQRQTVTLAENISPREYERLFLNDKGQKFNWGLGFDYIV